MSKYGKDNGLSPKMWISGGVYYGTKVGSNVTPFEPSIACFTSRLACLVVVPVVAAVPGLRREASLSGHGD